MKKILLILFTVCFTAQFSLAQGQARLSVAPLDSNVTCAKATVIPHTFNNNEFLIDSFANKGNPYTSCYYSFIAKTKSGKIRIYDTVNTYQNGIGGFGVNDGCAGNTVNYTKVNSESNPIYYGYNSLLVDNLIIGKRYIIDLYLYTKKYNFKLIAIANKKDDNAPSSPTSLTSNSPYSFNLLDYSYGREYNYGNSCTTNKADSNVVTIFVKFKATATTATLDLNLNNASLESRLGLTSAPNTCQAIQSNKNLRTDTFTGLTIGNEYTVRIEIGGDAALGYARTATSNNASITLVDGSVTGVENNSQPTFSIAPNPSNGNFTFVSDENADIVISDLLGSKVADLQNVTPNQNIDLQLPKGIYLLNVSIVKGSKIEKMVIE
ncbi:MAG: hypothetical protein RLZZ175_294 [Bacteroidota bacterium]|jgi:hypothetical protein